MQQEAAPTSGAIKASTGMVLAMTAGFLIASLWLPVFLIAGLVLAGIAFVSYLYAPVAYELAGDRLIVRSRRGEKEFAPVLRGSRLAGRLGFSLRLWGNGGLFAATGIFWNSRFGIYRAYITSCRPQDLLLMETDRQKIIISPRDVGEFLRGCPGS